MARSRQRRRCVAKQGAQLRAEAEAAAALRQAMAAREARLKRAAARGLAGVLAIPPRVVFRAWCARGRSRAGGLVWVSQVGLWCARPSGPLQVLESIAFTRHVLLCEFHSIGRAQLMFPEQASLLNVTKKFLLRSGSCAHSPARCDAVADTRLSTQLENLSRAASSSAAKGGTVTLRMCFRAFEAFCREVRRRRAPRKRNATEACKIV